MTGFGSAEGTVGDGVLQVEIRTVNHRYFNLSTRLPSDLVPLEGELRERLRREFERGHVTVSARWVRQDRRAVATLELDPERARAAMARLRELQAAVGLSGDIPLDLVARQPDVFLPAEEAPPPIPWAAVEPVVARAAEAARAMRAREGQALADELGHRLDLIEGLAGQVRERAPLRVVAERDRLRAAVGVLLDGRSIDEGRLAQEIALLADRLDITEELVRLAAHLAGARAALAGARAAGKELGFLAQEMGREVNTIGSKANDAPMAQAVIAMKGELERFREQLENLE